MKSTLQNFYTAFQNIEPEKMVDLYHSKIEFEDPAFGKLNGEKAKNMWRMLCSSSKDLEITFTDVKCDDEKGTVDWEARYTFSKTGRKIHNKIRAEFEFKDGKIIKHIDNFSLYKWSIQAFGIKGIFLGWTPQFKSKLNRETNKLLEFYERRNKLK